MKEQRTTKKVKVVGVVPYINANTGEIEEMTVTNVEERDFNFTKVWMRSFISTLDLVGNQKTKVAFWIIENLDKENRICYSQRQMAEEIGVSLQTVNFTIKALLDADFLRKQNLCSYIVNPDIVFKGTRNARLNILTQYADAERVQLSDDERLENLKIAMQDIQNSIAKLEQKILHNQKVEEIA